MTEVSAIAHSDFTSRQEEKISARMALLLECHGDYAQLDAEQTASRTAWWEGNQARVQLSGSLVRQGYTLFLIVYLGLEPAEVPVVYEDDHKIVWRSFNFCPTLIACRRLGLDTRVVCRAGTEHSVQSLIARLDPRLRFSRNYERIRPYALYCEECIELISP